MEIVPDAVKGLEDFMRTNEDVHDMRKHALGDGMQMGELMDSDRLLGLLELTGANISYGCCCKHGVSVVIFVHDATFRKQQGLPVMDFHNRYQAILDKYDSEFKFTAFCHGLAEICSEFGCTRSACTPHQDVKTRRQVTRGMGCVAFTGGGSVEDIDSDISAIFMAGDIATPPARRYGGNFFGVHDGTVLQTGAPFNAKHQIIYHPPESNDKRNVLVRGVTKMRSADKRKNFEFFTEVMRLFVRSADEMVPTVCRGKAYEMMPKDPYNPSMSSGNGGGINTLQSAEAQAIGESLKAMAKQLEAEVGTAPQAAQERGESKLSKEEASRLASFVATEAAKATEDDAFSSNEAALMMADLCGQVDAQGTGERLSDFLLSVEGRLEGDAGVVASEAAARLLGLLRVRGGNT